MIAELKAEYNAHVLNLENIYDIKRELTNINADKRAFDMLIPNMNFIHVKLEQVDTRVANTIKQQINKIGGEAAISKEAYSYTARTTDMIISSSKRNIIFLAKKIASKQFGLEEIAREIEKSVDDKTGLLVINKKTFDFNHNTYISGMIDYKKHLFGTNISDKMIMTKIDRYIESGVDMIELSGEHSSGNSMVDEPTTEDIDCISRIIYQIKKHYPDVVLSIDAVKFNMAKAAIDSGADIINDIIPIRYNLDLIKLVAKKGIPLIIMYNPLSEKLAKPLESISEVIRELQANVNIAISNGVSKDKIMIDPGIGFGRKDRDNFLLLRQLSSLKHLKLPILVGMSRRSYLSGALAGRLKKTLISTIVANTIAIINGANIVRMHSSEQVDVMKNIIEMVHPKTEEDKKIIY